MILMKKTQSRRHTYEHSVWDVLWILTAYLVVNFATIFWNLWIQSWSQFWIAKSEYELKQRLYLPSRIEESLVSGFKAIHTRGGIAFFFAETENCLVLITFWILFTLSTCNRFSWFVTSLNWWRFLVLIW